MQSIHRKMVRIVLSNKLMENILGMHYATCNPNCTIFSHTAPIYRWQRVKISHNDFWRKWDFYGNIFLIPFSIKCQWLVPHFECKVYQIGKNRSSKHSLASLFWNSFLYFLNIVPAICTLMILLVKILISFY